MNLLVEKITKLTNEVFFKAGFEDEEVEIFSSSKEELGEYQCNKALEIAKKYSKNPREIANTVSLLLEKNKEIKKVTVAGPGFINIKLNPDFLTSILNVIYNDEQFAFSIEEKNEKIIIDYGGPNVAKDMHVGHLRSAIIGESIKRILRKAKYEVLGDIHYGDWGKPLGVVIAYLEFINPSIKDMSIEDLYKIEITQEMLASYYPKGSIKSKEDEEFNERALEITKLIQEKDERYYTLWKLIKDVSSKDIDLNNNRMHVYFDIKEGESDSHQYVEKILSIMKKSGHLYKSQGALVVDVQNKDDDFKVPPIIVQKSNGSFLYSTSELSTIYKRYKEYKPSKIYYVVDNRQHLHFLQAFRCAKKTDLVPKDIDLNFFGFGTMNGKDGKPFKTRDGNIYKLNDLLDDVYNESLSKLSNKDYKNSEKEKIAEKVSISAIKFGDLINYRRKDYVFDADKFLSFEGKTGPYILYTLTRIKSILNKAKIDSYKNLNFINYTDDSEKDIIIKIISYKDYFDFALRDKAPNNIAEFLFSLATLLNKFYAKNRILDEENKKIKNSWLKLLNLSIRVMEDGLDLLAIPSIDRM